MGCFCQKALHNYYGLSPNQLVFGKNPNFPSVLIDKPSALDEKTSTEIFANHLNAIHAACKVFIEAEASEKLRRAIKAKVEFPQESYISQEIFIINEMIQISGKAQGQF